MHSHFVFDEPAAGPLPIKTMSVMACLRERKAQMYLWEVLFLQNAHPVTVNVFH